MNCKLHFTLAIEGMPGLLTACLGTFGLALGGMALALVLASVA